MSDPSGIVGVIAFLCAMALVLCCSQEAWRRSRVARWAGAYGCTLLELSPARLTEATPFVFTVSKAKPILRITVTDQGVTRTGWLRLGHAWGTDEPEIRWDQ